MSQTPINQPTLNEIEYLENYKNSVVNNEDFWAEQGRLMEWAEPFKLVKNTSFNEQDLHIRWFEDGKMNVCVNCVDRHLPERGDKTAIIWEGDNPDCSRHISYTELHQEVCKLANAMESLGLVAGDRVVLYMPMIPEAAYSMLACARLGLIHSIVFGGFSATALADRIDNCEAKLVITADEGIRGQKPIPLKAWVDEALTMSVEKTVKHVLVATCTGNTVAMHPNRDIDYSSYVTSQSTKHEAQAFDAEHPLFILYTSGSTGKPKGLQHSSAGYLTYTATTFRHLFDHKEDDVYWCTADVGWITGHSYIIYGPLANGATTLMFEGVPTYPDAGRFGQVIDKHKVSIFYTAPTAIRALLAQESVALASSKRSSLRLMGSVGEPINPEVWHWYDQKFGLGQCEIIDTWWQTETGGAMLSPFPFPMQRKPGAAMTPFYGIQPALVDKDSNIIEGAGQGELVILDSWPGQSRTIWGDHKRFYETYFSSHKGMYFSGDGARRDEDGDYWITGRVDDVLNISGHRLGTAEIESAAVSHVAVAEAAVVGYPHPIKGEAIYVYVIAAEGARGNEALSTELRNWVRKELGPVASPDIIQWAPGLPKTRSGKIMRRILRKIAANDYAELGDTSTLADPSIVDILIDGRMNR